MQETILKNGRQYRSHPVCVRKVPCTWWALCLDSGNRQWRSMLNLPRRRASRWSTPASRTGSTTSGAARKRETRILAPPQIPGDEITVNILYSGPRYFCIDAGVYKFSDVLTNINSAYTDSTRASCRHDAWIQIRAVAFVLRDQIHVDMNLKVFAKKKLF